MTRIFGVPDMPSKALDFALYSDGTILFRNERVGLAELPKLRSQKMPSETARLRYEGYLPIFRTMKSTYNENCWISIDGTETIDRLSKINDLLEQYLSK